MFKRIITTGALLTIMAAAVGAFSFGIDTPSIHLTTRPGSVQEKELFISNQSDETLAIAVTVEDWIYREDRTKKFMKKGGSPYSCAEWVTPGKTSFTIAPRKKERFTFSVKTPNSAEGGHQAVIFFEGVPATANAGGPVQSGVQFSGKIGAVIYQHTEGNTRATAEVTDVSAVAQNGSVEVSLQFRNTGNDWIQAKGNAVLVDAAGKTVGRGTFSAIKTLPGETVPAKADVKGFLVLSSGTYKVMVTLDTGTDVLVKDTTVVVTGG